MADNFDSEESRQATSNGFPVYFDNHTDSHKAGLICATSDSTQIRISSADVLKTQAGGRCIILSFDGTGNEPGNKNSNVVEFHSLLWKDMDQQPTYYFPGIGTAKSGLIGQVEELTGKALAWNIRKHIVEGYEFLMDNYKEGDRICLFGFSRGAYVARALAGMLYAVGLLAKGNSAAIINAYKIYKKGDSPSAEHFKEAIAGFKNIDVMFVGAWDTVASVGASTILPRIDSNPAIKTFRHALALDERRVKFEPLHYTQADGETSTSAREVWFPGCHSNVGGGSDKTGTRPSLPRVALRWMVGECFNANTRIQFKEDGLRKLLEVKMEDYKAAKDPKTIHDELVWNVGGTGGGLVSIAKKAVYQGLEFSPTFNPSPGRSNWESKIPSRMPNAFRGRTIPLAGGTFNCHTTVKTRMNTQECKYIPQATLKRSSLPERLREAAGRRAQLDVSNCQWVDSDSSLDEIRRLLGV